MGSRQGNKDCYALALLIVVSFYIVHANGEKIGVRYGMLSDSLPYHNEEVNLMQSNNIGKVRLYFASQDALQALKNSGIEVIVGVRNAELQTIADDQDVANIWVNDNIKQFYPSVNIKYIAVGNEVFLNRTLILYLLPAMENIQRALRKADLQNNIKVSTPYPTSVLNNSFPPSEGTFGEDMSAILNFLSDNGSTFMAHVYPYFSYKNSAGSTSADYSLFRSTSTVVTDGNLMYNNLFDVFVDAFISAMEKLGHSNIPIVITESGWPTAGNAVATVDNARTYNNNLIKHVLSNAGTPKRPGTTIETYIFTLFNENQKTGSEARHFGLFDTTKIPVYPMDFLAESSVYPPLSSPERRPKVEEECRSEDKASNCRKRKTAIEGDLAATTEGDSLECKNVEEKVEMLQKIETKKLQLKGWHHR
ncbi:glucan endo-1,3-beta-glucosidase-like [Cryptomeria japonica]|uniref:glucan endo-1,3-beta-glucosidase-like n=1 Tax=Cryptomeria japonica TaxID=3369 RepID=UPI0027D9E2E4|nr:glucan endo-1,3-beta-glucosidase-like [Cryptomeria japonica]